MSMNCSKELERRKGMSSEEFVGRLKNLLHQVRIGAIMRTCAGVCVILQRRASEKMHVSQ